VDLNVHVTEERRSFDTGLFFVLIMGKETNSKAIRWSSYVTRVNNLKTAFPIRHNSTNHIQCVSTLQGLVDYDLGKAIDLGSWHVLPLDRQPPTETVARSFRLA